MRINDLIIRKRWYIKQLKFDALQYVGVWSVYNDKGKLLADFPTMEQAVQFAEREVRK